MKKITKLLPNNRNIIKSLIKTQKRCFRDWTKNQYNFPDNRYYGGVYVSPYKSQFTLTPEEKEANDRLPVQERILDFDKYMHHKGELKFSTGLYVRDVEPFPRLKIMMLCHIILQLTSQFNNEFLYTQAVKESMKFIMEVVDQNEVLVDIENALVKFENLENLILKLDNEVHLLRLLLKDDCYKAFLGSAETEEDYKEMFFNVAFQDLSKKNAENVSHRKNEKPERPNTMI